MEDFQERQNRKRRELEDLLKADPNFQTPIVQEEIKTIKTPDVVENTKEVVTPYTEVIHPIESKPISLKTKVIGLLSLIHTKTFRRLKYINLSYLDTLKPKLLSLWFTKKKLIVFIIFLPVLLFGLIALLRFAFEPTVTPENIKITNLTDQSFTVSYITKDNPTKGAVYIREDNNFLPIISKFNSIVFNDTRDELSYKLFGSDQRQRLYTHSIDVTNLKPETKYYIRVEVGNTLYDIDTNNVLTLKTSESNVSPSPIYGRVMRADEINPQMGALIYLTLVNNSTDYSTQISTATNNEGNYTLDLTTARDKDGNFFQTSDKTELVLEIESGNRGKRIERILNVDTQPVKDISLQIEYSDTGSNASILDTFSNVLIPISDKISPKVVLAYSEDIKLTFDLNLPEILILKTLIPITIFVFFIFIILSRFKQFLKQSKKIFPYLAIFVLLFQTSSPVLFNLNAFKVFEIKAEPVNVSESNTGTSSSSNSSKEVKLNKDLVTPVQAATCKCYCNSSTETTGSACTNTSCPDGEGVMCSPKVVCTNGAKQCSGNQVQTCSNNAWSNGQMCVGSQVCKSGACVNQVTSTPTTPTPNCGVIGGACGNNGICTPSGCTGEHNITSTPQPPPPTKECDNGQVRCSGKMIQNCSSSNKWTNFYNCDGTTNRCVNGSCSDTNKCVNERVNMGCEIVNGVYTGFQRFNVKDTGCNSSIERVENKTLCPVVTTTTTSCTASTRRGLCNVGTPTVKYYDVKPDCTVVERNEYDPNCIGASYTPVTKTADVLAKAAKERAEAEAKAKESLKKAQEAISYNPTTTGRCNLVDIGKKYDKDGKCFTCVQQGTAEKTSDKSCSFSDESTPVCGSGFALGAGYRFSKNDKCFYCVVPNSPATEVSCLSQVGKKVPESKLNGYVNCSDLQDLGVAGALPNQNCVTGLDSEGNLVFKTSAIVDTDKDGFTSDVDCNDKDPSINPGANDSPDGDMNCDGVNTYNYKDLNSSCSSSSQCKSGLLCAIKTSVGGNDEQVCQKSIQTALKEDISKLLSEGTSGWVDVLDGYTSGRFTNYSKACPEAKNIQDCNDNDIPDKLEQAFGINTSAEGKEVEKILIDAVNIECTKRVKEGIYEGNISDCSKGIFDSVGYYQLGSSSDVRKFQDDLTGKITDLFTPENIKLQNDILEILAKHSKEGDPFKCTSGEVLNNADQAFCKTVMQELNKDCVQDETKKSGTFSDVGNSNEKLCFTDVLASLTQGVGSYVKLLNGDTPEQAAYQNYCTNFKKQTGIDCNFLTSKDVEQSSVGTVNAKYLGGGSLSLLANQLSLKTDEELKDNCENQKVRGFLPTSFDCLKVKNDTKYNEKADKFSLFLSSYSSALDATNIDDVISYFRESATQNGLDPNKLEAFLRAQTPDVKELSYKLLFTDYMKKQGVNSSNTDYVVSMYSYVDCISNPTKTDLASAFDNKGFASAVNPNCKTEPVKFAGVGLNGPVLNEVKRCAPTTTFNSLDLSNYGKLCTSSDDCGGSSCTPMSNGVESYYVARNGTKLPNGETIDLMGELNLKSNLDSAESSLAYASTIAYIGTTADIVDFTTGIAKTLFNKVAVTALEKKASAELLNQIARNYGKSVSKLTKEELINAAKKFTPDQLVKLNIATDLSEAKIILANLPNTNTSALQDLFTKFEKTSSDVYEYVNGKLKPSVVNRYSGTMSIDTTDQQMIVARLLGDLNDPSLANIVGGKFRPFDYDTVVKDVTNAVSKTQEKLRKGEVQNIFGVLLDPVDPQTGKNIAAIQYGYTGNFLNRTRRYATTDLSTKPVRIFFYSDLPEYSDKLFALARKNGVSQGYINESIEYLTKNSNVGGFTRAGYDEPITVNLTKGRGFNGTSNYADKSSTTTTGNIAQIICHEECHSYLQVSSYQVIVDKNKQKAIGSVVESFSNIQGEMVQRSATYVNSRSKTIADIGSGYDNDIPILLQDLLLRRLKGGATVEFNRKYVANLLYKVSTDPVQYGDEFLKVVGYGDIEAGTKRVLQMFNSDFVKGLFDVIKPINESQNNSYSYNKYNKNIKVTNHNGILSIDTCFTSGIESDLGDIITYKCNYNNKFTLKPGFDTSMDNTLKIIDIESGEVFDIASIEKGITVFVDSIKEYKVTSSKDGKENAVYGLPFVLESKTFSNSYNLKQGWQTFTPVFDPSSNYTASTLLRDIASQGGYATDVSTYRNGKWLTYKIRGGEVFSDNDFQIVPGRGYFIKAQQDSTFEFSGVPSSRPNDVRVENGWNLIGINPGYSQDDKGEWNFLPERYVFNTSEGKSTVTSNLTGLDGETVNGYTAFELISAMNSQNIQSKIVTKWENGRYDSAIVDKEIEYGRDYYINPQNAYFVRVDKNLNTVFSP